MANVASVSVGVWALVALGALPFPPVASAQSVPVQNVHKIPPLEEAVRDLRQRLEAESRRVDALQRELARVSPTAASRLTATQRGDSRDATSGESPKWLQVRAWAGLKRGMSELDAIERLGPPSALRPAPSGAGKVGHYALEIGSGAFLSGSVTFEGGRVVAIDPPRLR